MQDISAIFDACEYPHGLLGRSVSTIDPGVVKFPPVVTAGAAVADESADGLDDFARRAS